MLNELSVIIQGYMLSLPVSGLFVFDLIPQKPFVALTEGGFLSLNLNLESAMRARKSLLIAVFCLFLVFIAAVPLALEAPDESPTGEVNAEANLVITSVSGPAKALLNRTAVTQKRIETQGGNQ